MKHVGVVNAPPVYLTGLREILSEFGYSLELVSDPGQWLQRHRDGAILVCIDDRVDLDVVVELTANDPDAVVVTLVDDISVSSVQASLMAGASGSIGKNAGIAELARAFDAAMNHQSILPSGVARRFAEELRYVEPPSGVDTDEIGWLRQLANGMTVAELGRRVGYSEREMYRRLRRLYFRLGVSDRTSALLKAVRLGWLG